MASVRPLNVLPSITNSSSRRAPRWRFESHPRRRPWPHSTASTTRSSVWRGLAFSHPAPDRARGGGGGGAVLPPPPPGPAPPRLVRRLQRLHHDALVAPRQRRGE